jgi:hypothetical protein
MEPTTPPTDGQASAAQAAGTAAQASPPSSDAKSAAASQANTAPAREQHREAFDRLAKGEKPDDVNRAVYTKKPAAASKSDPSKTSSAQQPTTKTDEAAPAETTDTVEWPEGMTSKDLNVLKRAQLDPDTWRAIPPSNQVKILKNLRESQAAADREFQQQQRQGKAGKQTPGATQTAPESEDAGTGGTDESDELVAGDGKQQQQRQPAGQQRQQAPAAGEPAAQDVNQFIDPKDLETLQTLGGDELAQTLQRTVGRVVQHNQQERNQLVGALNFLMEEHVNGHFNNAVDSLAEQPGLEALNDPEKGVQLRDKLKEKALLLHRAAGGNPAGYTFGEAVQDAAASLFKTNIHQTAQASLLASRNRSLQGSAMRGTGNRAEPRTLTPKERAHAIYDQLAHGVKPDEARRAVDGR